MKHMRFLSLAIVIAMLLSPVSLAEELGEVDLYAPEVYAKAASMLEEQEREAGNLEKLALQMGSPATRVMEREAREAWHRWELLLMELGR